MDSAIWQQEVQTTCRRFIINKLLRPNINVQAYTQLRPFANLDFNTLWYMQWPLIINKLELGKYCRLNQGLYTLFTMCVFNLCDIVDFILLLAISYNIGQTFSLRARGTTVIDCLVFVCTYVCMFCDEWTQQHSWHNNLGQLVIKRFLSAITP